MKAIILIFLMLLSWNFADVHAQSNKYPKAVIKYADGSFLIGEIIDEKISKWKNRSSVFLSKVLFERQRTSSVLS